MSLVPRRPALHFQNDQLNLAASKNISFVIFFSLDPSSLPPFLPSVTLALSFSTRKRVPRQDRKILAKPAGTMLMQARQSQDGARQNEDVPRLTKPCGLFINARWSATRGVSVDKLPVSFVVPLLIRRGGFLCLIKTADQSSLHGFSRGCQVLVTGRRATISSIPITLTKYLDHFAN